MPLRLRIPHLLPQAALALVVGSASAGGHFDVDDADTLAPGRCQVESWAGRADATATGFQHIGPACRTGPVELGLNLDRSTSPAARSRTVGPAVKWTWYGWPDDPLRAAVEFAASWDLRNHGRPSRQWLLPVTWQPLPALQLHANLGADWAAGSGTRTGRVGAAAEWAVDEKVSFILERNRAQGAWTTRGGLRFGLTPMLTLDLSAAKVRPGGAVYTVGLSHEFGR